MPLPLLLVRHDGSSSFLDLHPRVAPHTASKRAQRPQVLSSSSSSSSSSSTTSSSSSCSRVLPSPRAVHESKLLETLFTHGFPTIWKTREYISFPLAPQPLSSFTRAGFSWNFHRGTMRVYVAVILAYGVTGEFGNFSVFSPNLWSAWNNCDLCPICTGFTNISEAALRGSKAGLALKAAEGYLSFCWRVRVCISGGGFLSGMQNKSGVTVRKHQGDTLGLYEETPEPLTRKVPDSISGSGNKWLVVGSILQDAWLFSSGISPDVSLCRGCCAFHSESVKSVWSLNELYPQY